MHHFSLQIQVCVSACCLLGPAMLTVLISYLFYLLMCSWRQSRKTRGSLLEQLTELAEKDPSALKKLTALNDGTKQSVQLLPPVTLFQGARENCTEDFEASFQHTAVSACKYIVTSCAA